MKKTASPTKSKSPQSPQTVDASKLKVGDVVEINNTAWRVGNVTKSEKNIELDLTDIITRKKTKEALATGTQVNVPNVKSMNTTVMFSTLLLTT
jgi:translation elongation factor P/translation initiation factor 5A